VSRYQPWRAAKRIASASTAHQIFGFDFTPTLDDECNGDFTTIVNQIDLRICHMASYDMSLCDIRCADENWRYLFIVMVSILLTSGCVRRDGRNSECRWPGEACNHPVSASHLSADAEFAEDLAIRYADSHFGPRSPNPSETYEAERDQCMESLFEAIGKEHGVPAEHVSGSLGRNRLYIDVAENLPLALLYSLAAVLVARMIWRRYPPEDGYAPGITMALFVSLALAVGSTMLGEQWNWFVEGHRIGNNHMSYRAYRLFWAKHRFDLFAAAWMIFWLAAIHAARRARLEHSNGC